jgi:hypothetical protein
MVGPAATLATCAGWRLRAEKIVDCSLPVVVSLSLADATPPCHLQIDKMLLFFVQMGAPP